MHRGLQHAAVYFSLPCGDSRAGCIVSGALFTEWLPLHHLPAVAREYHCNRSPSQRSKQMRPSPHSSYVMLLLHSVCRCMRQCAPKVKHPRFLQASSLCVQTTRAISKEICTGCVCTHVRLSQIIWARRRWWWWLWMIV